jgi:large subunit ribosomal protein L32
MGVPKKKVSKSRRDKRRTHKKLMAPGYIPCPNCREAKLSHQVCKSCGYYGDREVVEITEG